MITSCDGGGGELKFPSLAKESSFLVSLERSVVLGRIN